MCYSALVERALGKTAKLHRAKINLAAFVKLYAMRVRNPTLKIPLGMDQYFIDLGGTAGKSIQKSIDAFRAGEDSRRLQAISDVQAEINELEQRLHVKVTKTHQNQLLIKQRKLGKLNTGTSDDPSKANTYRIYPFYFAPVITLDGDQRIISPMRYRILPSTGVEVPTTYNVFNARRDSLTSARNWKPLFGKKHAMFPFIRFYEWVKDRNDKKIEISFSPEGFETMWSACLFEDYQDPALGNIQSFAMVTDDPPPEVAATGHDRCPVFLSENYIDSWLAPKNQSLGQLYESLDRKQQTYYSHASAA